MNKPNKIKRYINLSSILVFLTACLLILIILVQYILGWFMDAKYNSTYTSPSVKDLQFEYKYFVDFSKQPIAAVNGQLLIDFDWAVPRNLYMITIEITNNKPKAGEEIFYRLDLRNFLGMLYDHSRENENIDEYGFYDAADEIFAFYKFIVAAGDDCILSEVFDDNIFDYINYKDVFRNDRFEDYFESGDTYKYATFGDIGGNSQSGMIGLFPQAKAVDGKTTTELVLFFLSGDTEDDNKFQSSIYEGRLDVIINRT